MKKLVLLYGIFLFVSGLFSHTPANAQSGPVRHQSIAVNPFFIPFGTITAEYERGLGAHMAAGISGWYEYSDVKARWVYAKCMYYPGGSTLQGFACGLTAGMLRGYRDDDDEVDIRDHEDTPIAGIMLQYNRLVGKRKQLLLGIGVGGRSALRDIDDNSPMERFDGDGRLVMGWLF